jgi:hypothetical protein
VSNEEAMELANSIGAEKYYEINAFNNQMLLGEFLETFLDYKTKEAKQRNIFQAIPSQTKIKKIF